MKNNKHKGHNIKQAEQHKAYAKSMEVKRVKMNFVKEHFNGNYYMARCNMMTKQMNDNDIKETIDGCPKTHELMLHEFGLMKMQATNGHRNAYFFKKDLIEKHGVTEQELIDLIKDYISGAIKRDDYDDELRPERNKAEFIKQDK